MCIRDSTVTAGPDETPYIVLAFNNNVTEDEIKNKLKVTKGGSVIDINWLAEDGEMDANAAINAMTIADMKKSQDDGKEYRLAVLRLKDVYKRQILCFQLRRMHRENEQEQESEGRHGVD